MPPLTVRALHRADICFRRAREFRGVQPRRVVADFVWCIAGYCAASMGIAGYRPPWSVVVRREALRSRR